MVLATSIHSPSPRIPFGPQLTGAQAAPSRSKGSAGELGKKCNHRSPMKKKSEVTAGSPGPALAASEQGFKVCGPDSIQTLVGSLLGRSVALVLCSQTHHEVMDLTREEGVVMPQHDWVLVHGSMHLNVGTVIATRDNVTIKTAKAWGAALLESDAHFSEQALTGSVLTVCFEQASPGKESRGKAQLRCPDRQSRRPRQDVDQHWTPPTASRCFVWSDLDEEAQSFAHRRKLGDKISQSEHDGIVARRKLALRAKGIELLDDWLIRHTTKYEDPQKGTKCRVEVLLEADVQACELELHGDQNMQAAPQAHKCIQSIETDSDSDEGDKDNNEKPGAVSTDPHRHSFSIANSGASIINYVLRRLSKQLLPDKLWPVDARWLGNPSDEEMWAKFQDMATTTSRDDAELNEFTKTIPGMPASSRNKKGKKKNAASSLPSWEAFFGAASQNLYYTPGTKMDYTPFLTLLKLGFDEGSPADAIRGFFQDLYFGTVPSAVARLKTGSESLSLTRVRSMIQRLPQDPREKHPAIIRHRVGVKHLIPVLAAPVDCYLKARGSNPPRTWISGMVQRLESAGARDLVAAARYWYMDGVERLLQDPKYGDKSGEYFRAFLRECHREIHDDIDTLRPETLLFRLRVPSLRHPTNRRKFHDVRRILMPNFETAAAEVMGFDPSSGAPASRRQRVLSKIIVDAFQLRMVGLSAILRIVERTLASPAGLQVVLILCVGGDHTDTLGNFFRSQGFTDKAAATRYREELPRLATSALQEEGDLAAAQSMQAAHIDDVQKRARKRTWAEVELAQVW
eukprot:TRINITY_DN4722_c0_g1_i1.p1 TRINITY_DN4722_c0_g1~~TRINITY_DN4722_c0_g1_i1.p1  ORF type:complete len:797 (+),score=134.14 TRINITY_DN4722_c0_g1_i1:186-2576(+)